MRLERTVAPSVEPVTLAEAKEHCRIEATETADDSLVTALIAAARESAERFTNRALINQTWKVSYDLKDCPFRLREIRIPKGGVSSITSIKTFNEDNSEVVLSSSAYRVSGDRVVLNENNDWPTLNREFDSVEIVFVAGYGAGASNVPEPIRLAIKILVAHWYESREAAGDPVIPESKSSVIPFGVQQILNPFRIFAI